MIIYLAQSQPVQLITGDPTVSSIEAFPFTAVAIVSSCIVAILLAAYAVLRARAARDPADMAFAQMGLSLGISPSYRDALVASAAERGLHPIAAIFAARPAPPTPASGDPASRKALARSILRSLVGASPDVKAGLRPPSVA